MIHVPLSILFAAIALGVVACNASDQALVAKLCAYDEAGQPILGTLATGIVDPTVQVVVKADNTIVHPAVVKLCDGLTAK